MRELSAQRVVTDLNLTAAASNRPLAYVSGPMRGGPGDGGPWQNTRKGLEAGKAVWTAGWVPVVPHLNAFWEIATGPLDRTSGDGVLGWLEFDFAVISKVDAVIRLPGMSEGADREVAVANELGIPVFYVKVGANGSWSIPKAELMAHQDKARDAGWFFAEPDQQFEIVVNEEGAQS